MKRSTRAIALLSLSIIAAGCQLWPSMDADDYRYADGMCQSNKSGACS